MQHDPTAPNRLVAFLELDPDVAAAPPLDGVRLVRRAAARYAAPPASGRAPARARPPRRLRGAEARAAAAREPGARASGRPRRPLAATPPDAAPHPR